MAFDTSNFIQNRYDYINRYMQPAHKENLSGTTNISYIIRTILLNNINPYAFIEKSGDDTDDYILRPIALLDVAYRDIQMIKDWPMSEAEKRRYHRTMQYMHKFFKRMYMQMNEEQIYVLNDAMEKMEEAITNDYIILKNQCDEALRKGFENSDNRRREAQLCTIHVCLLLPIKYLNVKLESRFMDLENASKNIIQLMRYYASIDTKVEADVDLNRENTISTCLRIFENKFFETKLTS